jgi:maltooligosyltrehalose trehalohydrolase
MEAREHGYFEAHVPDAGPGTRYSYQLGGRELPDPASRLQPEGVHGPSQVAEAAFEWHDASWRGIPLEQYILYELHIGTFTLEGTFDAMIPHLPYLRDLGITAIELMPVAQFPGERNWGYDGVFPFAAQYSYGGPEGLKRLVDACHGHGLAMVLDVVYNHLAPVGKYCGNYAPNFTAMYQTRWGPGVIFDGAASDPVRRFFVENALYWVADCHIDALRLDAVHAIHDESALPFLEELGEALHREGERLNRRVYLIAESDGNDPRLVRPRAAGGFGLDAQWNDSFHHALRTLLTGDRSGYYQDYGKLEHLAKAYREGFVYSGQYSAFRDRRHGRSSHDLAARQFVVFAQNHDQVGNRMLGERLTALASFESLKLAAGAVILSPFLPLIFMGEEYGESAPFQYFVSHEDPDLIQAVRSGRKQEFAAFAWQGEPADPQDPATFRRSKLNHRLREAPANGMLLDFYRELLRLRKAVPALANLSKEEMEAAVFEEQRVLCLRRWHSGGEVVVILCFAPVAVVAAPRLSSGNWRKLLDSSHQRWHGPGNELPNTVRITTRYELQLKPASVVVYGKEPEE